MAYLGVDRRRLPDDTFQPLVLAVRLNPLLKRKLLVPRPCEATVRNNGRIGQAVENPEYNA